MPFPIRLNSAHLSLYLVQHPGVGLAKDALTQAIWLHTAGAANNLNQSISALRRVLGESRGENHYIATVPGRACCFVAGVKTAAAPEPIAEREIIDPAFPSHQHTGRPKSHLQFFFLAGIGIVALALAVYYLWPTRWWSRRG
jgi:DNA-binding winged helix-turn-helix (wHTH) protein